MDSPAPTRHAAIDIGTNTLLMVIGEKSGDEVNIIADFHETPRLGSLLASTGRIDQQSEERAVQVIEHFVRQSHQLGVVQINAVATAALRMAANGGEVAALLSAVLNNQIEIISGELEAELTLLGVAENRGPCTVIDVGGGSTEIITQGPVGTLTKLSMNIGSVTLNEAFFAGKSRNSGNLEAARAYIRAALGEKLFPNLTTRPVFAVAGTPVSLAMLHLNMNVFDESAIEGLELGVEAIEKLTTLLSILTPADLVNHHGIDPGRSDILLSGALILQEICYKLEIDSTFVTCKGLRHGVLMRGFA